MSYEGYSQLLCKKGHYWTLNYYEMDYTELKDNQCPICGEPAIWENMVDTTNGSFDEETDERIDNYIELKQKSETSGICSACGGKHICEVTYFKPGEEGD